MNRPAVLLAIATCLIAAPAAAQQRGSAEDAKALLAKAAAHYQGVGRDQALKDFSAKGGEFTDRDLYVGCIGADNTTVAHGANPALIGKDVSILTDTDGKHFALDEAELGRNKGTGTVEYHWVNPVTKKIEAKVSFVQKMGDDVCFVGFYK